MTDDNHIDRRSFLKRTANGFGTIALADLLAGESLASPAVRQVAPRAKNVIFLHMAGAPSQLELFDYKPELAKLDGQLCPPSFLDGKRFAFIRGCLLYTSPSPRDRG